MQCWHTFDADKQAVLQEEANRLKREEVEPLFQLFKEYSERLSAFVAALPPLSTGPELKKASGAS